jgi:hypothetical protein
MSRVIGPVESGDLMWVAQRLDSSVASPAVSVDDRSRLDGGCDEPLKIGSVSSVYTPRFRRSSSEFVKALV